MEERQHNQEIILGRDDVADSLETAERIAAEVEVGEHRALGLAGRARCIDDRGDILWRGDVGCIPGRGLPAYALAQGLVVVTGTAGDGGQRLAAAIGNDDCTDSGKIGQNVLQKG